MKTRYPVSNMLGLTLGKPRKTKHNGRFYDVSVKDGHRFQKVSFTTSSTPLTTYGINKWGSVFLYTDIKSMEDGCKKFLEEYQEFENEILKALRAAGETSKFSSRLTTSSSSDTLKRMSAKIIYTDQNKTAIAPVFKNIEKEVVSIEELKSGKLYEIYPVITVKSIFVSPTVGIVPQLYISQAYVFKTAEPEQPKLDIDTIRNRYAALLLGKRMRHISFRSDDETKTSK
jgi:hypothetical protein